MPATTRHLRAVQCQALSLALHFGIGPTDDTPLVFGRVRRVTFDAGTAGTIRADECEIRWAEAGRVVRGVIAVAA